MKAFILAAGLGTRLRPWTLTHPKALVPVAGVPMLERVILRLRHEGFDRIVVNVHHFADQIIDFLAANDFGVEIAVSDEREALMDTGGALVKAAPLLCADPEPFLIHNVDILSNAPLRELMTAHMATGADATLLVSERDSSRRLLFDQDWQLRGWQNLTNGERRGQPGIWPNARAFSGIHVMNPSLVEQMRKAYGLRPFPVMDFYLTHTASNNLCGYNHPDLHLIDIGKPDTLQRAQNFL